VSFSRSNPKADHEYRAIDAAKGVANHPRRPVRNTL
jgi:hypothetical protein